METNAHACNIVVGMKPYLVENVKQISKINKKKKIEPRVNFILKISVSMSEPKVRLFRSY